jgi:sugar (pentulose or hexulose) kinase
VDSENIRGIGITGQGDGLWMMDKDGEPVRPGMCYCDGRTDEFVSQWRKDGTLEKAFDICGTAVFLSAMAPEIRWVEKYEKENMDKAVVCFHVKDWLFYKMTGMISSDESDMSLPLLNMETRRYDDELLRLFGIEQYKEKLPPVYPSDKNCHKILPEIAGLFGLEPDTIIASGPMDIPACALSSGVIQDGQACTIMGTAAIHSLSMDKPMTEPRMAGMTFAHAPQQRWMRLLSSLSGTPNLEWFLREIGGKVIRDAEKAGRDIYEYCSELIEKVPIGSNGVVYHPYLMAAGERAPFFKGNIKASFTGISFITKVEDMLRSTYEGVALAMMDCYSRVPVKVKEVFCSGGGAKSDVWMQMFADAMGADVVICEGDEHGARGAAMNCGVAIGLYKDFEDAVSRIVKVRKRYTPDPKNTEKYQALYKLYVEGYTLMMDWWDLRTQTMRLL